MGGCGRGVDDAGAQCEMITDAGAGDECVAALLKVSQSGLILVVERALHGRTFPLRHRCMRSLLPQQANPAWRSRQPTAWSSFHSGAQAAAPVESPAGGVAPSDQAGIPAHSAD